MKLGQYLEVNEITLGQFARLCGTSASTILRVKDAEVSPSKRVARAIWEATKGQVTPNDIFGLHHASQNTRTETKWRADIGDANQQEQQKETG